MNDVHKRNALIALVIIVVSLGVLLIFKTVLIKSEREVNLGYDKEARRNPMLASRLFLDDLGIESSYTIKPSMLDALSSESNSVSEPRISAADALVLMNGRGTLSDDRFDKLWQWINQGGTLITSLENPFLGKEAGDPLLDALGLTIDENYFVDEPELDAFEEFFAVEDEESEANENEPEAKEFEVLHDAPEGEEEGEFEYVDAHNCDDRKRTPVLLPPSDSALEVMFASGVFFQYYAEEPQWTAYHEEDDLRYLAAASFAVGDGKVFVLRSTQIWKNPLVQCGDNAYFLFSMVKPATKVWFLENLDSPSLFALMIAYTPWLSLMLCLAIALAVWSSGTRFGPLIHDQDLARRSFVEHIKASAIFLWRYGKYHALLKDLRHGVEQKVLHKVAAYEGKNDREKAQAIALHTDVSAEVIYRAMYSAQVETLKEFVAHVATLKKIKEQL